MVRHALVALAAVAFLPAWTPVPSRPAPDGLVTSVQSTQSTRDSVWNPQQFDMRNGDSPTPVQSIPLGRGNGCSPQMTKVSESACVPVNGSWGNGLITSFYQDGCGGQSTTKSACYQQCSAMESETRAPDTCVPSSGTSGAGSAMHYLTDGCGHSYTRPSACCVPADIVVSQTECVANNGVDGPGTFTKVHDNSCGMKTNETVSCTIAKLPTQPVEPKGNIDEVVMCIDFESYTPRPMPYDFGGNLPDSDDRVWGGIGNMRWDNRHSCAYKLPGYPPDTYFWGSPWYCTAWGHPDPAHGYCYAENPRYAYFYKHNYGEKLFRDQYGDGAVWSKQWAGSADRPPTATGLANLTQEWIKRMGALGMQYNAWQDALGYYQRVY